MMIAYETCEIHDHEITFDMKNLSHSGTARAFIPQVSDSSSRSPDNQTAFESRNATRLYADKAQDFKARDISVCSDDATTYFSSSVSPLS